MKNDLACRLKASDRIWLVFDNIAGYPSSSQILSLQATVLYSISKRLVIDAPLPHFRYGAQSMGGKTLTAAEAVRKRGDTCLFTSHCLQLPF
jgi:hypothetical protein